MRILLLASSVLALAGCGVPQASLMFTPVIYYDDGLDPLTHVDPSHRTTSQRVFYATNRARSPERFNEPLVYGNTPTPTLQLGMARVRYGEDLSWEALHKASRSVDRQA